MESLWVLALGNCSGCTLMKLVWNRRKGEFSHRNLFTYLLKTDENLDNEGTKTITPLLPIALAIKSRAFSFSYRVLHDVVLPLSPTHVIPCLTTLPSLWPPSVPQVLKILSARVSCMCCSFRMLCSWLCPWTCSFSFFRSQIRSLSRETFTNHCLQLLYIVFIVLIKFVIYYLSVFISPHNRRDLVLWQPASSWVPSLAPWGICVWITVSLGTTEKSQGNHWLWLMVQMGNPSWERQSLIHNLIFFLWVHHTLTNTGMRNHRWIQPFRPQHWL